MSRGFGHIALLLLLTYVSWLGMMVVHELGHVLHAWATGGRVERVVIPLLGFSRTDVSPSPRPLVVAWGGAVWGCILPGIVSIVFDWRRWSGRRAVRFFAGLCLISNGTYLGLGWTMGAGDAADLVRLGTPVWVLIAFGAVTSALGLYLWHRCGSLRDLIKPRPAAAASREAAARASGS